MKTIALFSRIVLLFNPFTYYQNNLLTNQASGKRTLGGHLDESVWQNAAIATKFTN